MAKRARPDADQEVRGRALLCTSLHRARPFPGDSTIDTTCNCIQQRSVLHADMNTLLLLHLLPQTGLLAPGASHPAIFWMWWCKRTLVPNAVRSEI